MNRIAKKLNELKIKLPACPVPVANYVVSQRVGNIIYASGQTAVQENGERLFPGKVGGTVTVEQAYQSARLAATRLISELNSAVDLDTVKIIKLNGYVNSAPEFTQQPAVINGASDLLVEVFGENGKHARTAIGVNSLPDNASVEVELIAEIIE